MRIWDYNREMRAQIGSSVIEVRNLGKSKNFPAIKSNGISDMINW